MERGPKSWLERALGAAITIALIALLVHVSMRLIWDVIGEILAVLVVTAVIAIALMWWRFRQRHW